MFYTRILVNPRHPGIREDKQNAYEQHRRIESLFPDHKRSDANVLFRWEQQTIFIQSAIEPRFDLLPKNYTHDVQTKMLNLDRFLKPSQWLEFRLLADASSIEAETRRPRSKTVTRLVGESARRCG
jgi:CRISPR system Cascade subunit CasE